MDSDNYFIGVDIGTGGAKAVLFNKVGKLVSAAQEEYQFTNPEPGWSEIDPEEVWSKTTSVIRECVVQSAVSAEKINALGLSVLGETTIALDENGNPLYPAIDSQDKREDGFQKYLRWFEDKFGAEQVYERTSYPLAFIAPALRLLWFQEHLPDTFRKIYKFVTFQDFALWQLTGTPAIDYSMASRTLMFDAQKKVWIDEYLEEMGISTDILSEPCLPTKVVGNLTDKMSRELGLTPSTLVVAGAHDQSCSALGVGAVNEGIASDGTGSVEAIATVTMKPFSSPSLQKLGFSSECHLFSDSFLALGYHLTAGSLVRWYRDVLGRHELVIAEKENKNVYDLITTAAQKSPPGSNGLLVLPHWSGAGTGHFPMLNPASRGAILGLTLAHKKSDISRAIFEGITYESRLIIETFEKAGIPIESFVVTGGGAKSPFWLQLKADIIGKPMKVPETTEASAMGAAMLAAVGSGVFKDLQEVVNRFCRIGSVYKPQSQNRRKYDQIFPLYRELYDAVIGINTGLSRLEIGAERSN